MSTYQSFYEQPVSNAPKTIHSIVESSLQTHTLTLQQETDLKTLLQHCEPLTVDTLEPVITLLTAITDNQVIPTPSRICRLIPDTKVH